MKEIKKVLMVIEGVIPSKGGGGAETQVLNICRNLQDSIDTLILAPMVSEGSSLTNDVVEGVKVRRLSYPKVKILGSVILLIKLFIYLIKNRSDYDVIHSHIANNMSAVCSVAGVLTNKKVIVKITGWTEVDKGILSRKCKNSIINICKRFAIKQASYIHATSTDIIASLIEFGFKEDQILYLPNSVNTDRFKAIENKQDARSALGLSTDSNIKMGIYVGRLVREKGMDLFLQDWCEAYKDNNDMFLLIIGTGTQRDMLQAILEKYKMTDRVVFLGARSNVEDYMKIADFGIIPSMHEGLSNTMLEYMSASLPVLATIVSGSVDYIKSGINGWLYQYGDSNHLKEILADIECMTKLKLSEYGEESRSVVVSKSSVEVMTSQLKQAYRD